MLFLYFVFYFKLLIENILLLLTDD